MEKQTRAARAVLYIRIATNSNNTNEIDTQRSKCEQHIKESGCDLVGSYVDEGASGLSLNHPALDRLRADAAAGKFDKIVVFDLARISRNAHAVRLFMDEMRAHGITVESVKEAGKGSLLWQLKRIK